MQPAAAVDTRAAIETYHMAIFTVKSKLTEWEQRIQQEHYFACRNAIICTTWLNLKDLVHQSWVRGTECLHASRSADSTAQFVGKVVQERTKRKCPCTNIAWVEVWGNERQESKDVVRAL